MKKMSQSELNRLIGMKIYKERIARKVSQEALSKEVGISRHFISMLENGNRGAKVDTYYRIAYALGMPLCELFRGDERTGVAEDILFMMNGCSVKEANALIEILRASKAQILLLRDK